jgi:hypothetical protein
MKINKCIIIVILLLFKTIAGVSQIKSNDELVKQFVKSVFFENKPAKFVADNYMQFELVEGYSMNDRIKILSKHLKKIKNEKNELFDLANVSVISYNEYNDDKVNFLKSKESIYILTNRNNPLMYFYIQNSKIIAFDYITKGNEGLFITY